MFLLPANNNPFMPPILFFLEANQFLSIRELSANKTVEKVIDAMFRQVYYKMLGPLGVFQYRFRNQNIHSRYSTETVKIDYF